LPTGTDLAELSRRQADVLGWTSRSRLATPKDAEAFLKRRGVVLRYAAATGVPLASLRLAAGPADNDAALEHSINLTNHLLGRAHAIEVNVIGTRLTLVDRNWMPALYRLVRRDRSPDDLSGLSLNARGACTLITAKREVSAGEVRTHLGLRPAPRNDPAYEALSDLQRRLLVDRGPFKVPKTGIPYLPREGYPYHFFHHAHADLVRAARALDLEEATDWWLGSFVDAAIFAAPRTLTSLFRLFLTPAEIDASIARLVVADRLAFAGAGRARVVVSSRSR
jgi:hypothetical protein